MAFPALIVAGFHGNVITYWVVLGIQSGWRYYREYQDRELRSAELESQLIRAQLSALKMQLQPHFLFNTLNAIMVLVRQQKGREAEEMLARFSDLLRCVLEDVEAQEVPLRRELEYLRLYLSIEQVRFQDRLRVEIHVGSGGAGRRGAAHGAAADRGKCHRHGIGRRSSAGTDPDQRRARGRNAARSKLRTMGRAAGGRPARGRESGWQTRGRGCTGFMAMRRG